MNKTIYITICLLAVILLISGSLFTVVYAESLIRSTSLQQKKTIEGNRERTDYINEDGVITDAADKHYATIIRTRDGNSILEEYYDSQGEPAKQTNGYYAILREFNDKKQEYRTTYLGIDKQPVLTKLGYAAVLRSFNENGKNETDHYLDTEQKPIQSKHNGYGSYKGYDEKGRNNLIIHLDENGSPMIAGNGYAMIKRVFYEDGLSKGKVKEEFYFDENEKPISLSLDQYGLYKEYDEYGRNCLLTYLDADGAPTVTNKGYTTIKRTFYEDDTIETEMYYDRDDNPVRLSNGQYGVQKNDGKTYYLDQNGTQYFDLKKTLVNNQIIVIALVLVVACVSFISGKAMNIGLLVIYIGCILYMTIANRSGVRTGVIVEPLWSYRYFFTDAEIRWEIVNNILLFLPLGFILYRINPTKKALLIPIALSILIEVFQLIFKVGLCETDDVISNGTGSILGYYIGQLLSGIQKQYNKK